MDTVPVEWWGVAFGCASTGIAMGFFVMIMGFALGTFGRTVHEVAK